ncbi:MAG: zinc-ribbon domain-containing protein [Clostridia bacterium]|nr:zinc-ribbon domain-containing protein [Clostridia bacterium]
MAHFCGNCGASLRPGASFCESCGAAVEQGQPVRVPPYPGPASANDPAGGARVGIPAPGYSDRVNHPEILKAVKKNRRAAGIFGLILVPMPLIGFIVFSFFSEDMELAQAALYGGVVSVVFLLFALYGLIKSRASNSYEGTVIDQKTRLRHHQTGNGGERIQNEYITVVRTAEGKKKKIVETEGSRILAYNYLKSGDRFKYHPQFNFPYEHYDKSRAPYIACVSCGAENPVGEDRCGKCRLPLLK